MEQLYSSMLETSDHVRTFVFVSSFWNHYLMQNSVFSLVCLLSSSSSSWYLQGRLEYLSNRFLYFFFSFSSVYPSDQIVLLVKHYCVVSSLLLNTSGHGETSKDKASTSRVNVLLGGQEIWQLLQKLDLMVHTNNLSVLVNVNSFPQSGCFCFVWTA